MFSPKTGSLFLYLGTYGIKNKNNGYEMGIMQHRLIHFTEIPLNEIPPEFGNDQAAELRYLFANKTAPVSKQAAITVTDKNARAETSNSLSTDITIFYTLPQLLNKKALVKENIPVIQKEIALLFLKYGFFAALRPGKYVIDKYTAVAMPAFNIDTLLKKLSNKSIHQINNFLDNFGNIVGKKSWVFQFIDTNLFKYIHNKNYSINIASPKE